MRIETIGVVASFFGWMAIAMTCLPVMAAEPKAAGSEILLDRQTNIEIIERGPFGNAQGRLRDLLQKYLLLALGKQGPAGPGETVTFVIESGAETWQQIPRAEIHDLASPSHNMIRIFPPQLKQTHPQVFPIIGAVNYLASKNLNAVSFLTMNVHGDALVGNVNSDNSKYCLAKAGSLYLVYLPDGGTTEIDLSDASGTFTVQWFNPRHGGPLQHGSVAEVQGGGKTILGAPPKDVTDDWLIVLAR